MKILFLTVSAMGCALSQHAYGQASFDCNRASTQVEITICNSQSLSMLDLQMAIAYGIATSDANSDISGDVIAAQRAWLARRDSCGNDEPCLAAAMRDQTVFLWGSAED